MKRRIAMAVTVVMLAVPVFGAEGTKMSAYPELPEIADSDIFVVTRPGDATYKYSWNQVLSSVGLAIKEFSVTNNPTVILTDDQYADLTNRLQAIETAIGAPKTNSLAIDSALPVVGQQGTYNVQVSRDTTATGIPADEILAPEIRWQNVAISATNSITLHNFKFWSPGSIGATMWTNYFRLWICSAPITWGETNAVWAPVETELGTNLLCVIDSMDTTRGRWIPGASGTNLFWQSHGLSLLLKPKTNDLFLYFQSCNNDITNVLPARASFDFFRN